MTTERTIDFRYAPASRWTAICRPDDPYKTLVDENGSLLYDFVREFRLQGTFRFEKTIAFAIHTDQRPIATRQRTESARGPVVVTEIEYPDAILSLRTFGHQHDGDRRTDVVLWSIQPAEGVDEFLTAFWLQAQMVGKRFSPATLGAGRRIYAMDPADVPKGTGLEALAGYFEEGSGEEVPGRLAFVSDPHPLRIFSAFDHGPASGLITRMALVTADVPLQGALFFPQNHNEVTNFSFDWAQQALAAERRFWEGYELQQLPLQVPNDEVMAMITACARNILQAREVKEGIPEFQVGATVYRGLWVVDGHFFLEAAQYLGYEEAAAQGIDALLRRVRPTGAIYEMESHTKETGIALATLIRQCELAGRLDRLEELWPVVRNAVAYIEQLREESKARGPDAPEYGLMPISFGDGGLGGMRAEYTTTLWTLFGLKEAVRMARELEKDEDAGLFQATFDGLMAAFRRHAERDMRQLPDGTPYLPMMKPGSGDHHWIPDFPEEVFPWEQVNPSTATWALAQAIYPGEVFPPDDPIVQNFCHLLDLQDDEEGIPAETGWLPYKALWPYAASFYAHVWLYAGRPDKAVDYLYDFANHATPTRVWREEQSLRDTHYGQKVGDMPHNWASAEFIRLVRNLLVFERGDELELLPGLPPEWVIPGETLRIHTPTRFGVVKLTVDFAADGQTEVAVALERGERPRPRAMRLYAPGDATQATIADRPVPLAGDGALSLPPDEDVTVRFATKTTTVAP